MEIAVRYVLSILEAGLSGVIFGEAAEEENLKWKFVLYICGAIAFCLSLLDSFEASRQWKEIRAAKKARAIELDEDEGDYE